MQIWDSAGQERFRALTRSYWRGAAGCLLVYDITNRSSFLELDAWVDDIRRHANAGVVIVLIGNKLDLEEYRQISTPEGHAFADARQLRFLETSALTGEGVQEAFTIGSRIILSQIEMGLLEPDTLTSGITFGTLTVQEQKSFEDTSRCTDC